MSSFLRYVTPFSRVSCLPTNCRNNAPSWPPFKATYQRLGDDQLQIPLKDNYSANVAPPQYFQSPELLQTPTIPKRQNPRWNIKGWQGGARVAFYSALTVLVFNVILTVVCATTLAWMDGMTMVYVGSCTTTERINNYVHLGVNLLGTALLAGSNYCMQLLSSPTRADVDKAHARGHWLDIGVPSLRNLRSLEKKKVALWWILAVSSVPLHLFYNSVFFSAIATNDYHVLYATEDFVRGAPYDQIQFLDSRDFMVSELQAAASSFQNLSRSECVKAYGVDFITDRKDVVVIVRDNATFTSSLQKVVTNQLPETGFEPSYDSFHWICDDPSTVNKTNGCCENSFGFIPCQSMVGKLESIADTWWKSAGFDIDYCLSNQIDPQCHEHFAPAIMAPVLFFNLFKAIVIWYVAFRYKDKPLVTIGDAVESFITDPDATTEGMCLADPKMIEKHWRDGYAPQPFHFDGTRQRWWHAVSRRQWLLLTFLFSLATCIVAFGLGYGITTLQPATLSNAWSLGLGTVRQQNLITGLRIPNLGANAVFVSALIANMPQALFSFIYLVYNTVFGTMFLGREWDRFGTHAHGRVLRVSDPREAQRSTYFLQVPYRYAIVLLLVSGVMHWLVSQSIFLANILILPLDGDTPHQDEITTCAYSPQAMILLLVVGLTMLSWLFAHAIRRYSGRVVMVGSCSAAISAACHVRGKDHTEREEMVLKAMRWGATNFGSRKSTPVLLSSQFASKSPGIGRFREMNVDDEDDFEPRGLLLQHQQRQQQKRYEAIDEGMEMELDRGISTMSMVGHCTFSDGVVGRPVVGRLYA